jgi:hypothetical protein
MAEDRRLVVVLNRKVEHGRLLNVEYFGIAFFGARTELEPFTRKFSLFV